MAHRQNRSKFKDGSVVLQGPITAVDADGVSTDLQGYDSCLFVVAVGAEGDTLAAGLYIAFIFEHDDDDGAGSPAGTWATVDTTDLVGSSKLNADADGTLRYDAIGEAPGHELVAYVGKKRHVRCRVDIVGTHTTGTEISVVALRGHKQHIDR